MSDPKEIYLAPKCCPDPEFGRCWATDDEWPLAPGDEDNGHYPATRYVRADIHEAALKRQAGAARTLQASTLETVRHLQEKDRSEYTAGATLESEREANALLTAENERLRAELKAAIGYMLNAQIDLETGATKATAVMTIKGGIKRARAALPKTEGAHD